MQSSGLIICTKCGASSATVLFCKWKPVCKPCIAAYDHKRRLENPELLRESYRRWEKANKDRRRALHHETYLRNRERYLEKRRSEYEVNPEKFKLRNRRSHIKHGVRRKLDRRTKYAQNPEPLKLAARQWRAENPAKLTASLQKYYQANKAKFLDNNHKRKAAIRKNGYEPYSFADIIKRDNGICHICGKKVPAHQRSRDHLVPISRGGADAAWNVALAHLSCNIRRGADRLPAQLRLLG